MSRDSSHCCAQISDKKQAKEGRICCGSQSEGAVHHGRKSWWQEQWQLATWHPRWGSREINAGTQFIFSITQPRTRPKRMVPPIIRVVFPSSAELWEHLIDCTE